MDLRAKREAPMANFVMGVMTIDGAKYRDTLEDPPRDVKIPGRTGIPVGKYEVVITYSNRFKKPMPLLVDFPGFSGIRIHGGRDENDTDGCILVGYRAAIGLLHGGIPVSAALNALLAKRLETDKVFLTVE